MSDPAPNADLMGSLANLIRGLSALFWGLPIALLSCAQPEVFNWFKPFGFLVPPAATGLLLYGTRQLSCFQKQERVWLRSVEATSGLALTNLGLSPFLYFWNQFPNNPFFGQSVGLMALTGLFFLLCLNSLLYRLVAMLPDEMLRHETRIFTTFNAALLALLLCLLLSFLTMHSIQFAPRSILRIIEWVRPILLVFLVLLPLAMTMTLLWKTKETILASVFGGQK